MYGRDDVPPATSQLRRSDSDAHFPAPTTPVLLMPVLSSSSLAPPVDDDAEDDVGSLLLYIIPNGPRWAYSMRHEFSNNEMTCRYPAYFRWNDDDDAASSPPS